MRRLGTVLLGLLLFAGCGGDAGPQAVSTSPATASSVAPSTTASTVTAAAPSTSATLAATTVPGEPTGTEPPPSELVWIFGDVVTAPEPGDTETTEWFEAPLGGIRGTGRSAAAASGDWGSEWWEFVIGEESRWVPERFVLVEEPAPSGWFAARSAPKTPRILAPDLYATVGSHSPGGEVDIRALPGERLGPVSLAVRNATGLFFRIGDSDPSYWFRAADLDPAEGSPPEHRMFLLEGWVTLNGRADGFEGAVRIVDAAGAGVLGAEVAVSLELGGGGHRDETISTDDEGWARVVIDERPASLEWLSMEVRSISHPLFEFAVPSAARPDDGATPFFGWMAGCCEPEYPLSGEFGGGAATLCPVGAAAEVREAWDFGAPLMATLPESGIAVPGGGVVDGSGRVWFHVDLGERRGYVLASSVRACEPDPACVPGWVRPEPWVPLSRQPFDALRDHFGLANDETFVAETILYFNGSSPLFGSERLRRGVVGFWYIEGRLESDSAFRGRWILVDLPHDHPYGSQVLPFGFAEYESEGFGPGTWLTHEPGGGLVVDPFEAGQAPLWRPDTAGCLP